MFFDQPGLNSIEEFRSDDETRIFIIANEDIEKADLSGIPFILHFDQPEEKEVYISRVIGNEGNEESLSIVFATDIELSQIAKIEQATGQLMEEVELPLGLIIENNPDKEKVAQKKAKKEKLAEDQKGTAFHEKKATNAKTYNYSSKEKAKMKYKKR
ncbi:putative DEAD-box ATP-dependent RNA helicase [compost metagenome]